MKNHGALIACGGAANVGVGAGWLIVNGWLPWEAVLGALVLGLAYATYRVRDDLRLALAAKAKRFPRKPRAGTERTPEAERRMGQRPGSERPG
jgi:hypothetical protein